MKSTRFAIPMALFALLGGCATDGPATSGASLRATLASQNVNAPRQARADVMDGAAAVEVVKNYADSYANPRPQSADSAFGR